MHASSLTTWENACDCKRARVQPGYAVSDVLCACAGETFAADLIRTFPGQAVGCESSEHSSARNIFWDGSGMRKAEGLAQSILVSHVRSGNLDSERESYTSIHT